MTPLAPDVPAICAGLEPTERDRLIYGRTDWRMADWQDHCGDVGCPMCEGAIIPEPAPHLLSIEDPAVRDPLRKEQQP